MTTPIINFVTFLWTDPKAKHRANFEFGPDHVNKLFRRLREGAEVVGIEAKFTVVSDRQPWEFDKGISFVPMWEDFRDLGRCFTRLKLFSKTYDNRTGQPMSEVFPGNYIVMIDLDVVIIDPTRFVENFLRYLEGGFVGYYDSKNPRCYSGAMWMIPNEGKYHYVYDTFRHVYDVLKPAGALDALFKNWNAATGFVGSDQCWLTTALGEGNFDRIGYYDGVWDYWQIEHLPSLPEGTCAVFLNGMTRSPCMKSFQDKHPWIVEHWKNV